MTLWWFRGLSGHAGHHAVFCLSLPRLRGLVYFATVEQKRLSKSLLFGWVMGLEPTAF